jgi:hypothetical protein
MPVVFVSEFDVEPGDRSTTVYDTVTERLKVATDVPAGLICHTAGFADDVFRILDVWETKEQADQFFDQRLTPTVKAVMDEVGEGGPPARQYFYELHDFVKP